MPEWNEILVILVVAMVVFGPHRLPEMARKAGKMMAEFRVAARELREGIEKELAVEEMRQVAQDVVAPTKEAASELQKSLSDSEKALKTSTPLARPTDTRPGAERAEQQEATGDQRAEAAGETEEPEGSVGDPDEETRPDPEPSASPRT
ncbi:MAG: twin-arginine translocase subunit TatB [Acidimicrobiia bacterium]|nr:twin-arginine translocase subunit TatB [Acidimicrobiia bacterium]MXY74137.1 twin-arginine translocase subunit TatB [Acidimicrobiia bacterium]MYA39318.1 twin-arginine translocase subunit TatB [Acidimicrobiia bacterium]MYB79665.1 twin-arginine translocase subunit TatB [Acidimicrobiia bacterium]MYD40286.1 twin-arginine translocase subunit TatB [Acidimicrobiia bacterium]